MTKKKTSPFALMFAAASLAGILAATWYVNDSDVLTDVDGATETIRKAGYKPVSVGGYSAYGCGRGEFVATGFTAQNAEGTQFSGTVCKTPFGRQRITFE